MTVALTKMTAMNKTCFKHPLYFTLLRNKVALFFWHQDYLITKRISSRRELKSYVEK